MRRTKLRWVFAALAVMTVVAGASPAGAEDPDPRPQRPPVGDPMPPRTAPVGEVSTEDLPAGFASWAALFAEQHRLNAVADRIEAAGRGDGYAGLIVDPENHDVRLYWKGALPAEVQSAVDAGRRSVPVQVFQAAYSADELRAEAQRWLDSGHVVDAYEKADGSGLVLGVAESASAGPPQLPGGTRVPFEVEYDQSAEVPLNAEPSAADNAVSATWWRQHDQSPYWGGARYETPGSSCTTGFAVTDNEGYPGFLTAGHCGEPGDIVETYVGDDLIGKMWSDWDYQDIALIWAFSNVEGRAYVGPWHSNWQRPINSAASNYVGNYVCTNGAASGEHCAIKVYYRSPSDVTIKAKRTKSGACAVAHGDSGGPVIAQSTGAAFGHGIITNGANGEVSTCGYGYNGEKLKGYRGLVFKGLKFALGHFGATLRTAPYHS
ncbi:S1 family peptidase [Allorhizocola rhizosphaerae]|uniref:S1 family peptidase n=1 Tax=Allorhizocola rhizosphaerae TaxID=1872709 RepID=UPI000E3C0EFB|nr:S1 family peptidase [Allorhizocola rhizosphaerae]